MHYVCTSNTTLFQCLLFYRTGREFTVAQQYGGVALLAFPLFWLAGAGSVIFWVIGASLVAVLAHAGLYKLDVDDPAEAFELEMEQV